MANAVTLKTIALSAAFICAGAGFSSQLQAQQVYRIVGPDGKVSFSDKPPPATTPSQPSNPRPAAAAAASGGPVLPLELRNTAQRYPVVLYTRKECAPCDSGRNMLRARGIPFNERTVESNEDITALRGIMGGTGLPALSIGAQQLKGYSDLEWSQYLDLAGYPKTSQLPASYRPAAATPLVARTEAAAPATAAAPAAPSTPAAPAPAAAPAGSNPAGIRF
jgi:glutaredoxin